MATKDFDPDVEVSFFSKISGDMRASTYTQQDGSGWTPLMIAASLRESEGDPIIDILLHKGADVNVKSTSGQVSFGFDILLLVTY